jgi:hypothetical protein
MPVTFSRRYLPIGLFFASVAFFILPLFYLYGYLGFYSRFIADDYCIAAVARDLPWYESQIYWYINWHGAYIVTLLDELLPILTPDYLPFVVPVLLVLWFLVLSASMYTILSKTLATRLRLLLAALLALFFLFAFFLLNPQVPQTLFWWSGMRSYNLPILFFILFMLFYARIREKKIHLVFSITSGVAVGFILAGFREVFVALLIVFLALFVALELYYFRAAWYKTSGYFFLMASAMGILIGTVIILSSPGNSVRQGLFPEPPGLFKVFLFSLLWFSQLLQSIFQNTNQVLGLLGTYLLFFLTGMVFGKQRKSDSLGLFLFVMAFAFLFGVFIPSAYATSQSPPERTISLGIFFFLLLIAASGFVTGQARQRIKGRSFETQAMLIAIVAVVFLSVSAYMEKQLWLDQRDGYVVLAQQWDDTHALILSAKNNRETTVHIPPLRNLAALPEPEEDVNYWVNGCFANYYGVDLAVQPELIP